jgi:peptidoglycan lytic transglycosylase
MRTSLASMALAVSLSVGISGCAEFRQLPVEKEPRIEKEPRSFIGTASFYGDEFRGRITASGERYDPTKLTAAHRSYPFGTRLHVTNLSNGKSVVVRINDRGPYAPGRTIDVSARAARELDMLTQGTVRVSIAVDED